MDTWKHNLPRLDYEEIECLNSCTITKEIESVIENLSIKIQDQMASLVKSIIHAKN